MSKVLSENADAILSEAEQAEFDLQNKKDSAALRADEERQTHKESKQASKEASYLRKVLETAKRIPKVQVAKQTAEPVSGIAKDFTIQCSRALPRSRYMSERIAAELPDQVATIDLSKQFKPYEEAVGPLKERQIGHLPLSINVFQELMTLN